MGTLATAVQRTSGPSHAQVVSQSSPILFGRGAAFGLLGNWDSSEQKGRADLHLYSFTSYAC